MDRDAIINDYFDWLCDQICNHRERKHISFDKLLIRLHCIEFKYLIPMDEDRARDGVNLRWRYSWERGYEHVPACLNEPCSVLEMMIALSLYCEENIMDDPNIGNRTGQWFWNMIVNMGLGGMVDRNFDKRYVTEVVDRFLKREYEPNGKGGLFKIDNCEYDVRDMDIQRQLCRYLNNIT